MTTRVRVINFGPDPVRVKRVNPASDSAESGELVYPGQISADMSVYDTSNVLVVEEIAKK
jgi:hypothetical protein